MQCKPPLGITPRFVSEEKRIQEIQSGINRFINAKYPIPIEWVEELNEYFEQKVNQNVEFDNVYKCPDVAGDLIYVDSHGKIANY